MLIKDNHKYQHLLTVLLMALFFLLSFLFWWYEGDLDYKSNLEAYPYYPKPVGQLSNFTIADFQGLADSGYHMYQFQKQDLKPPFSLPTVSLKGSPGAFFGPTGLYSVNKDDPERQTVSQKILVELIDTKGKTVFTQSAKASVSGVSTKRLPMKSLNLYFNQNISSDKVFEKNYSYPLYSLRLRNAGNDFLLAFMRDALVSKLTSNTHIIALNYQPVAVLINDEFWGVQYLRERVSEKTLLGKFPDLSREQVILGEIIIQDVHDIGNGFEYKLEEVKRFIMEKDLNDPKIQNELSHILNLDNFIDYIVFQTFISNTDWPHNNVKCAFLDDRLHFILYDTDISLTYISEYFEHTNDFFSLPERYHQVNEVTHPFLDSIDFYMPTHVGEMHGKLIQYKFYRQKYEQRYRELLQTNLSQQSVEENLKSIREEIAPLMPFHIDRWGYPSSPKDWMHHTEQILKFSADRRTFILNTLINEEAHAKAFLH